MESMNFDISTYKSADIASSLRRFSSSSNSFSLEPSWLIWDVDGGAAKYREYT
jgi:hypothetical protein